MANVKYRVREFTPKQGQSGVHSFFAEAVIDNETNNQGLAKKIAARTGFKSYEVAAVIASIADVVAEECLDNHRVSLSGEDGSVLVSFYPKVSGRVSDTYVNAHPLEFPGKTVAEEEMLTADRLKWTLGASVGVNFSKQFAHLKRAAKVSTSTDSSTPTTTPTNTGGTNTGGGNQGGNTGDPDGLG